MSGRTCAQSRYVYLAPPSSPGVRRDRRLDYALLFSEATLAVPVVLTHTGSSTVNVASRGELIDIYPASPGTPT